MSIVGENGASTKGMGRSTGLRLISSSKTHGKEHQTATIQLDFRLPQRFKLQYQVALEDLEMAVLLYEGSQTTLENGHARPVIIYRAILGSLERFMALLIEHYAGIYPFWPSPRPAIILSLNQNPEVLSHVHNMQRQLSGHAHSRLSNGLPSPQLLERIPLTIDTDTSPQSSGKRSTTQRSCGTTSSPL